MPSMTHASDAASRFLGRPDVDSACRGVWATAGRLVAPAAIGCIAVGFAMFNGLQVGRSNHWQYLLHGLHAADPQFLQNDWFTTQTPAHHGAFNFLVQWAAFTGHPAIVL
ncbi:MAG: hypothetical protein O7D94_00830, partial [Planctomycetota bacterium]|nr:hypothetical protein [Planctomycetota bacterium]